MTDEASLLLAVAGLDEADERVYLFVVHRGRTRPDDVAARFDLPVGEALSRLEVLRDLGLVTTWQGSADVYAAVDPRYALGAVADRVSDQVRRIREQIPVLSDHFERALAEEAGTARTRVVTDTGEVAGWFVRLQHQAKSELVIFDRPPYVSNPQEPLESIVIGRGVSWRAVYSSASFSREGAWEETARLADQGEQGRVVPSLPLKLVIADRAIALVSLDLDGVNNHALVTESSALVELLLDVFEGYWGRGIPLTAISSGGPEDLAGQLEGAPPSATPADRRTGPPPTREQQSILALIGSGLTDEAIATRLGLSVRSLRRRSQQLMTDLGAENRFQLGVEAARRGWV
jgi:sugar-specific transcriptional regulator TrmB/DNA-binding CsgD family transcriptional regulator